MKKTTIKSMMYEKSPKENLELVMERAKEYKPTLKWAIPAAAVYGAYRILKSNLFDLSVNNISEKCEEKLGFKVALFENKVALKELMVIGGISAGAYGAVKLTSGIFGRSRDKEEEISVEDVEKGMKQLESVSRRFAYLQPKIDDLFPIAISVIFVYVTVHKPNFNGKFAKKIGELMGDFRIRIDTYIELVKLFLQDKFNIDLFDEQQQDKLKISVFLIALLGVLVFLYGKKILQSKKAITEEAGQAEKPETNKAMENFVEQAKSIIQKISPSIYTTVVTFLISKKILESGDVFAEYEEVEEPEEKEETEQSECAVEEQEVSAVKETEAETESESDLQNSVE